MPSHNVHVKWSKIICGIARPDVDKFLDDFIKSIDLNLLENCVKFCKENLLELGQENIEALIDFYESVGIEPTRYLQGLLFYSYLPVEDSVRLAYSRSRTHDSWKLFDPCIVLCYVHSKFGPDGAKVATVHMVLDEIARLCKIDYTTARRGAEAIITITEPVLQILGVDTEFLNTIRHKIREIIIDVAFSIGLNLRARTLYNMLYIYSNEIRRDILEFKEFNLKIVSLSELTYEESASIVKTLRELEQKLHVRFRVTIDKITGKLVLGNSKEILVVTYRSGTGSHTVAYPHWVKVHPVGDIVIKVEDYLQDLRVMRPGSMTR